MRLARFTLWHLCVSDGNVGKIITDIYERQLPSYENIHMRNM
jgi:hypothetical protein